MNKLVAELIGTFTLVAAVLGAALVSFSALGGGSGILGVAIAVGLAVVVMAYALGPISGGHFNPAVTLGLWSAGRFDTKDIVPYIVAQLVGGFLAALFFYIMLSTKADFTAGGFASNGYGEHSPAGFSLIAALLAEIVQTFLFVLVICRVTRANGAGALAPLAIGLTLTLMHIMSIPIANTSVNPARSTATVFFADGWALQQLWLFWVAPIIGGLVAGVVDKALGDTK
ncbi:MAG: aquaporin Z [Parvibaculaceae bacterium]